MKTDKPKTKGRTPIVIDWDRVDKYLQAGLCGTEIAPILGISEDTIYLKCQKEHKMTFTVYSALKKASGDGLLKTRLYSEAMGDSKKGVVPNTAVLIFLAKTRLNMTEKKDINLNVTGVPKVSWIDDIEEPENEASDE